jgi:hypothetical protein
MGVSTSRWVVWVATSTAATNATRSQGRGRSKSAAVSSGYATRLKVNGVTSGRKGHPLWSARRTWSRWWTKPTPTAARSAFSAAVGPMAGWDRSDPAATRRADAVVSVIMALLSAATVGATLKPNTR